MYVSYVCILVHNDKLLGTVSSLYKVTKKSRFGVFYMGIVFEFKMEIKMQ